MARRYDYAPMSVAEFRDAMNVLGLSVRSLERISGAKGDTIDRWLKGDLDVPHHIRVLLALLALPGALERAKQVTTAAIEDNRP
jgi:hypothetical protein